MEITLLSWLAAKRPESDALMIIHLAPLCLVTYVITHCICSVLALRGI